MRPEYTIKHWLLTLALSPFTGVAVAAIIGEDPNEVLSPVQAVWVFLLFGLLFSAPAFLIYFVLFLLLEKFSIKVIVSKIILITAASLSVIFTFLLLGMTNESLISLKIAYIATAIITGIFLKLEKPGEVIKNTPIG